MLPLYLQLYSDICPRTCANFLKLCTAEEETPDDNGSMSYLNTVFHRIVKNGWIQGGGEARIMEMTGIVIEPCEIRDSSYTFEALLLHKT